MNGRDIAEVALKTWAVVLLAGFIISGPAILIMIAQEPEGGLTRAVQAMQLVQLLAGVLVGLGLLIWARKVSRWVIPETQPLQVAIDITQLSAMAFALAGVFILVDGLQDAVSSTYIMLNKPRSDPRGPLSYLWEQHREATLRAVVQMAVGIYLILSRKGVGRGWSQLRGFDQGSEKT